MTEHTRRLAAVFLDGAYEDAAFYCTWAKCADAVIAADGGAAFLMEQGLLPDLVVGDFDSLAADRLRKLRALGIPAQRHPRHKDMTDGELAVAEALRMGADEIVLAGALGALDHTLGHLAILLRLAHLGVRARLISPALTLWVLVAPAEQIVDSARRTRISVVPLAGDAVVSLRGVEYPLERGLLPGDGCLGLGNSTGPEPSSTVIVHEGAVAVYVEVRSEAPERCDECERS